MIKQILFPDQRKSITALIFALILILLVASFALAAYRVRRPILQDGGEINQWYLYGEQTDFGGGLVTHRGIDFSYGTGTPVYAVASGTVVDLREDLDNGERNPVEKESTEWQKICGTVQRFRTS